MIFCFKFVHVVFICIIQYAMNKGTFQDCFSELKNLTIIKLVWITASLVIL